ncbi:MAG: hypothetical protein IJS86_02705 [Lachnospiraceae bacterium]|nr:hypothetical protein [Lachnospiraceae bacterium]
MSKRNAHIKAVTAVILCLEMILSGSFLPVYAAKGSDMVTAGEASVEIALTPDEVTKNESIVEERLSQASTDAFSGNDGEEGQDGRRWEVITIHTDDDLKELAKNCALDTWSKDKYVLLEEDIRLINSDFTTIPVFNGIFDGNGHRISEYSYSGDGYVTGLFRYIGKDGVVKDLELFGDITAVDDKQITGGFCGINQGVIRNCTFEGKIKGKTTTGAMAAINEVSGLIGFCRNEGKITGYYYTGGIAGKNYGTISDSENEGSLNNSVEWVSEEDEMSTGAKLLESLKGGNTDENPLVNTGTDTGGIAGISKGSIIRCKNSGTVGYEHTGYNTGGIAGRQSGIIAMCENEGRIYGRKDIGGIVGQMEPHLEPDDVQSLTEAVDKLHDLVDVTINNADGNVDVLDVDLDNLTGYANGAVDTTNAMSDQFKTFMNSNMDTVNTLAGRVRHISGMMPGIFDSLERAAGDMSDVNDDLKKLIKDLDIIDKLSENDASAFNDALAKISENRAKYDDATSRMKEDVRDLEKAISDNDVAAISECNARLAKDTADAAEAADQIAKQLDIIYTITKPYLGEAGKSLSENIARTNSDMKDMIDELRSATRSTRGVFDYINSQSELRATKLGSDWDNSKNLLSTQLSGVFDAVNSLGEHSKNTSHQTNSDLAAVNDQLNVVFHILADDIDGLGKPKDAIEKIYTDVSDVMIESITSGRTDNCMNSGIVRGDINIGGICGAMDVDDNDPEQNAAGDADYSPGEKYLLKNIICDCRNTGEIESKKDGAGGIVGYMAQGIVTSCEGYGLIESTEGGYAGGIAGQSHSIIRNSWVLACIGGKNNVGGIAGYGTTLADNICMPTFTQKGSRFGSIAGQVQRDDETGEAGLAVVSGNRFVNDEINGIDGVSYRGIAEPADYRDLLQSPMIPKEFSHLKVKFRIIDEDAEDDSVKRLGEQEVPYRADLSELSYPVPEEKEGYYVTWPDLSGQLMTGVRIVEGEYIKTVKVVESVETYPDTERPLAYIDGTFERETALSAGILKEPSFEENLASKLKDNIMDVFGKHAKHPVKQITYSYAIAGTKDHASADYKLRLYNPCGKKAKIYRYEDGKFTLCETRLRGAYAETDASGTSGIYVIKGF